MVHTKLEYLFPNITDDDYELTDRSDGAGAFISDWSYISGAQPTLAQLTALDGDPAYQTFMVDKHRAQLHSVINIEAKRQIEDVAKLPPWKQRNADKGLYETGAPGFSSAVDAHITGVISASNVYQTALYDPANDTIVKLDAIPAPVWPSVPAILLT